jgi:hypothetical protein
VANFPQILEDRVCRSPVPLRFIELLLCWHDFDELAQSTVEKAPAQLQVSDQALGFVLCGHPDAADSGVDTVGQREVNDPELSAEGYGWFCSPIGELVQPRAAPAGQHDSERCSTGKSGFGGIQIHGGKDNRVENNLFVDCAAAVSFTPWGADRWREFVNKALDSKDIDRELYLRRYPELAHLTESPNTNLVRSNITLRCGELLRRSPKAVNSSDNTILAEGDFAFPANTKLLKRPGFSPIPVSEIGLHADKWRKTSGALRPRATP